MMELCSLASGSKGNCICVGTDQVHVLVDAGISGKKIKERLATIGYKVEDMDGILITHEHIDHIAGLGVMARRHHIPIYATADTIEAILQVKSVGEIDRDLFHPICAGQEFSIGELQMKSLPISHDAADPVAYRFSDGTHRMAVVTDLGMYTQELVAELQDLDGLLLEANHDINMLQMGSYPYQLKQRILGNRGHLSNELSGQLLCELLHDNFNSVLLGHLSPENNLPELAYESVRLEVTMGDNPYKAGDFPVHVAQRDDISQCLRVE